LAYEASLVEKVDYKKLDKEGIELKETIVEIYRCVKVIKGGRKFSFAALAVMGDGAGIVGTGYGKANEVPLAITKALQGARKNLFKIPLEGNTIPHKILGRFGAAKVVLIPAASGTGIIAGGPVRAVMECLGVRDLLSKSIGSNNAKNVVKATIDVLKHLKNKKLVEKLRGVTVE